MIPVLPGAEPLSYSNADASTGIVCLHGFGGSPATVKPVAQSLASVGFNVVAPRLPGHGTSSTDMATTDWSDWEREAERAINALAQTTRRVVVVGVSMGGTLALSLAARHGHIDAVVVINPLLVVDPDMAEQVELFIDIGGTEVDNAPSDIKDPTAAEISYSTVPLQALQSLYHGAATTRSGLNSIAVPNLVITSRNDHVVPVANSTCVVEALGDSATQVWLEESYHVATLDLEHRLVSAYIRDFVRSL